MEIRMKAKKTTTGKYYKSKESILKIEIAYAIMPVGKSKDSSM